MSVPYVQREAFRSPGSGKSYLAEVLRLDYAFGSTDLTLSIPADAAHPVLLYDVAHIVRVLFSGGTPSIEVGDGTDPNGYIDTLSITEGTAGDIAYARDNANSEAFAKGKYLTANGKIVVTVGGSPTAGAATVLAFLYRLA